MTQVIHYTIPGNWISFLPEIYTGGFLEKRS